MIRKLQLIFQKKICVAAVFKAEKLSVHSYRRGGDVGRCHDMPATKSNKFQAIISILDALNDRSQKLRIGNAFFHCVSSAVSAGGEKTISVSNQCHNVYCL